MMRGRALGVGVLLALAALLSLWLLRAGAAAPQSVARRPDNAQRARPQKSTRQLISTLAGAGDIAAAAGPAAAVERAKFEEPRARFERKGPSNDDPGPGPYLERYQGRSGRLSPHASQDANPPPIKNTSTGKDPELAVWVLSTRVTAGQTGSVRAALLDGSGKPLAAERIEITRLGPNNAALGEPSAMPAGSAGAEYGYELPTSAPNAQAGGPTAPEEYRFVVRASGTLKGQPYEREAGGFFYAQHAGAKLDAGSASTSFDHGNLELTVQVTTERAGSYFAGAELWGGAQGDQPIAFARQRLGQLLPGVQTVTLLFGGQVIEDAGIDGPYTVRNVQLLQVDAIPPHNAEPITALPATRGFRSRDFY